MALQFLPPKLFKHLMQSFEAKAQIYHKKVPNLTKQMSSLVSLYENNNSFKCRT